MKAGKQENKKAGNDRMRAIPISGGGVSGNLPVFLLSCFPAFQSLDRADVFRIDNTAAR